LSVSNFQNKFLLLQKGFQSILPFENLKPCGIADLTASTASEAVVHISISRNDFFLVSSATATIAQLKSN
jgi:hypothetical protein